MLATSGVKVWDKIPFPANVAMKTPPVAQLVDIVAVIEIKSCVPTPPTPSLSLAPASDI